MPATTDSLWEARDAAPAEIEAAVRRLAHERQAQDGCTVAARVLNLVVVVDHEWSGEIANRLRRVGRFHPSRTIVCSVEPDRTEIDAHVIVAGPTHAEPGELALLRETIVLDLGPGHLRGIATIVDALVKPDIATLVWSPHGHHDVTERLLELSQIVLVDSLDDPDPATAVRRALSLTDRTYVVDLAWLRSTPWRERIAGVFDPANRRDDLKALTRLEVRYQGESRAAALLLAGWLASRLGWEPSPLVHHEGGWRARLHARRQDVTLDLVRDPHMPVPGLSGITIETAHGDRRTLDRAAGGLRATLTRRDGHANEWTALGASRGESGILGEGIRQALLRDHTYLPALRVAEALAA